MKVSHAMCDHATLLSRFNQARLLTQDTEKGPTLACVSQ
jgi:hypothetical protein